MPAKEEYTIRLENATARLRDILLWHPHPWLRELASTKLREAEQTLVDASFEDRSRA